MTILVLSELHVATRQRRLVDYMLRSGGGFAGSFKLAETGDPDDP